MPELNMVDENFALGTSAPGRDILYKGVKSIKLKAPRDLAGPDLDDKILITKDLVSNISRAGSRESRVFRLVQEHTASKSVFYPSNELITHAQDDLCDRRYWRSGW